MRKICCFINEDANGNGLLIRVLLLAIWHQGSDGQLMRDAYAQSYGAHAHLRSKVCCATLWFMGKVNFKGLLNMDDAWHDAVERLRVYFQKKLETSEQLESFIRPDEPKKGTGSGYVVDCLKTARYAL